MSDLAALFPLGVPDPLPGRRILICAVCAEWIASGGGGPMFRGPDSYWGRRAHLVLGPETDFVRVLNVPPVVANERCGTCARNGPSRLYAAVVEGAIP